MASKIIIRPCRIDDLGSVWKTFLISFEDMIQRVHGSRRPTPGSRKLPPYLRHVLGTDARGFWVAESNGEITGFACSMVRGSIWFLCDFWVLPEFQDRGIGRTLLKRSLQSDRRYRIISTYSSLYPSAMRSYIMLGMTPRFPVYTLTLRTKDLQRKGTREQRLKFSRVAHTQTHGSIDIAVREMSSIDFVARGSRREEDHEFFIRSSGSRCWIAREQDRAKGYFYVTPTGQIGPIAVWNRRDMLPVLHQAIETAAQLHLKLSIQVPSPNVESIRALIRAGFRIDSHAIFMSSKEFGRMENYISSGPALF
jgi:ribosomal protein S18 acetylase RimI-like enzyme